MNRKGLSLIEVLIGVVLLSVAALGAFSLQNTALQATREARLMRGATDVARASIERLRAAASTLPATGSSCSILPATQDGYDIGCTKSNCGTISASGQCTAGTPTRAFEIQLTVSRHGKQYVNLTTLIRR